MMMGIRLSLRSLRETGTLRTKGLYGLAVLPVLLLVVIKFFLPSLHSNEAGKLISARQVLDPAFLGRDWVAAPGRGDNVFDSVFALLVAPLWLCMRNSLMVALAARLVCWGILLAALVRLARTLCIEWYALSCGLGVWICNDQDLGAKEWIFRSAEAKCLAYALLIFALNAALRKRFLSAGVFCGLATCCHVLVGGWGTVALGGAVLLGLRDIGWRRAVQFTAVVVCISMPALITAILYVSPGAPAEHQASDRLAVLFADPFHLDPAYFGGWQELAVASVLVVCAAWVFFRICSRVQAKLLGFFLVILLLEFSSGLLAWKLNWFWFLKTFPFRVPDVLIFLFFALALSCLMARLMVRLASQVQENRSKPRSRREWRRIGLLAALACLVFGGFLRGLDAVCVSDLPLFVAQWHEYLLEPQNSWREMTEWIRANTPPSAIFLAPPWEYTFWIDAERAQVVNLKRPPHNVRLLEWHRRLTAVNGRPFQFRGSEILNELRENYPQLSPAQVGTIRDLYGADYYLTTRPRADLHANLVHVSGSYYLFELRKSGLANLPVVDGSGSPTQHPR